MRSISHASEVLHISRQALSQSIRNLEESLGVELFERKKDGVIPTQAGELFYESVKVILNEERIIRNNMLSLTLNKEKTPKIRISAPQVYVNVYGDLLISNLLKQFPQNNFVLSTIQQSDDMEINKYDINVMTKLNTQSRVSMKVSNKYYCQKLLTLPLYIWVNSEHPLAKEKEINFNNLRPYHMCVLNNTYNGREVLKILGLNYDPIVEVRNNLKDYVLNEGYWALDLAIGKGKLMYEELFGGDDRFVKIKTMESSYLYLIYRKEIENKIINIISNFIVQSFRS